MKRRSFRAKSRRGLTLPEVMISAFIMLGIVIVLSQFSRINTMMWQNGMADSGAQNAAQMAVQKLAPYIRSARRVDAANSTPARLALQMPAYDAGGDLIVPLQDGEVMTFYLSDNTGSPGATGSVLWRAVNGTPDAAWSRGTGSAGRVVLQNNGLSFSYVPAADPESVIVTVSSSKQVGTSTQTFSTSQEVVLHNHNL